jgi:AraC-like DNA-binding protein
MEPCSHLTVTLRVNGFVHHVQVDARTTLLDLLREHLDMTGTKGGRNFGECSACTVHLNGRRINGCERLPDEVVRARTGDADEDGDPAVSGIAAEVTRLLVEDPGRFDDMETIAARMNITSRTLRRRLQAEGTSYLALLADVRCTLAKQYLSTTHMSIEDIAEALGFTEAANFRHAFRRWTGRRPGEFRSG